MLAIRNVNNPALGDAGLIAALVPTESDKGAEVRLPDENPGSIDSSAFRSIVEETPEGGKSAFEL